MNNWHNSLRKVKNVTKERAGEKIFWIVGWQKKSVLFPARDIAKNVREKSNKEKEEQEGLIAKLKCQ
jgi:hypothetical protein